MVFAYICILLCVLLIVILFQRQRALEKKIVNLARAVGRLSRLDGVDRRIQHVESLAEELKKTIDGIGDTNTKVNDELIKGLNGLFNYNIDDARKAAING